MRLPLGLLVQAHRVGASDPLVHPCTASFVRRALLQLRTGSTRVDEHYYRPALRFLATTMIVSDLEVVVAVPG